jgi:hypothetical protein
VLSDKELLQLQIASEKLVRSVAIHVAEAGGVDAFGANIVNVGRQISGVTMNKISIEYEEDAPFPGKSSLTLSAGGQKNVHYLAAPEGPEFGPFLDALLWLGRGKEIPDSHLYEPLRHISEPIDVLVLIASACPHCPHAVRAALGLAAYRPSIAVTVADAQQFPDLAERFKVKSTPTTIVNDGLTIVGQINVPQLVDRIASSGQTGTLTAVLRSMIESGRAEDAGGLLCRQDCPEAILPLYTSKEFSLRMGSLVAMEAALEENSRALDPIVSELSVLLSHDEVGLRGDTAELLGKIGDPSAIPALTEAILDSDPDVREAALEALQILKGVSGGARDTEG